MTGDIYLSQILGHPLEYLGFAGRGWSKLRFYQGFEMAILAPLAEIHVCLRMGFPSGEVSSYV